MEPLLLAPRGCGRNFFAATFIGYRFLGDFYKHNALLLTAFKRGVWAKQAQLFDEGADIQSLEVMDLSNG